MRVARGGVLAAAAAIASCGAAGPYASRPADLTAARTTVRPTGNRCYAATLDGTPVYVRATAPADSAVVGDVLSTRVGSTEERACQWAEDGAAHGARALGADVVQVTRRTTTRRGDRIHCDVQTRAYRRRRPRDAAPSRACGRETFEGLDDDGNLARVGGR